MNELAMLCAGLWGFMMGFCFSAVAVFKKPDRYGGKIIPLAGFALGSFLFPAVTAVLVSIGRGVVPSTVVERIHMAVQPGILSSGVTVITAVAIVTAIWSAQGQRG